MKLLQETDTMFRSSVRQLRQSLVARRSYHDESFGFRKPRGFQLPDCASSLLPVDTLTCLTKSPSRFPNTTAESGHKCASPPICRLIAHSRASRCTHRPIRPPPARRRRRARPRAIWAYRHLKDVRRQRNLMDKARWRSARRVRALDLARHHRPPPVCLCRAHCVRIHAFSLQDRAPLVLAHFGSAQYQQQQWWWWESYASPSRSRPEEAHSQAPRAERDA